MNIKELATIYSAPCPRYTSYPTAVELGEGYFEPSTISSPLSLYVHLPYCKKPCLFCACNKIVSKSPKADKAIYLKFLNKELKLYQDKGHKLSFNAIHLGGGTPSFFDADELTSLNKILESYILPEAELSIEIDPRDFTPEQAAVLRDFGYKRASLGVQDFNPKVETAIGRRQSFIETLNCTELLRKTGFSGINFDLVYGLPYQDLQSFQDTLLNVIDISPDRIALYGFAYVPWKAKLQEAIDKASLPSPATRLELFLMARELLQNASYKYIGLDHFAKEYDPLYIAYQDGTLRRNFMGYTTNSTDDLLAIGISGISDVQGTIYQNFTDIDSYSKKLLNGENPVAKFYTRTAEDILRGTIIENLMCFGKLNFRDLSKKLNNNKALELFEKSKVHLQVFEEQGIINLGYYSIEILEPLFSRQVASTFDAFLEKNLKKQQKIFSQGS